MPLTLAVSREGLVFDRLFYLVGGRQVDYPHVLEHDGHLFAAFSGRKQTVEILRVRIADLHTLRRRAATSRESGPKLSRDWRT